jgi:predicted nucleic acid-binding protein
MASPTSCSSWNSSALTAATIADVPELHDRMIAATGKYHQLPVITNDPVLAKSKHITTIW